MNRKEQTGLDEILFIGAGNMAEAIIKGMLDSKNSEAQEIRATDIDNGRIELFKKQFSIKTGTDNAEAVKTAKTVILSIKPQIIPGVLKQISDAIPEQTLVISIAAGITTGFIESALAKKARVARVMPNTPALVGKGISAYCCGCNTDGKDEKTVETIFRCVGTVVKTEEHHMNAVTALSGSGPAYLFFLCEIMIKAGTAMGLDNETSAALATDTIEGAAAMLKKTGLTPEELRRRVTSKGGTTEAAFNVIEKNGIRENWINAIEKACERAGQLSENTT